MSLKSFLRKGICLIGLLTLLLCSSNLAYSVVLDTAKGGEAEEKEDEIRYITTQTPEGELEEEIVTPDREDFTGYAPREVLVKFKEGANPQDVLQKVDLKVEDIKRIHSIRSAVAKFKKNYRLKNAKSRGLSFRALRTASEKSIEQLPDEEIFEEVYKEMPSKERALYRSYKITLPEDITVRGAINELEKNPDVEYAEPDYIYSIQSSAKTLPDDPYYGDLWGLERIEAPLAWDLSQGEGVVVAVVDTGIDYNHEDIFENIWVNPDIVEDTNVDGVIDIRDVDLNSDGAIDESELNHYGSDQDVLGYDFATYREERDNNPMDDGYGHGTHVAGTIAAVGNNGIGIIGVAPKAKVMAVKGLSDSGRGYASDLAACIKYAVDNKADVINNSYGGYGYSRTLEDEIGYAHSLNCVIVASAGNDWSDRLSYFLAMPASYEDVITVGAISSYTGSISYTTFSNYGYKVDVYAPGCDILSLRAQGTSMGDPVDDNYTEASGTSMAAPHVSGLAALIRVYYPDLSNEKIRQLIRVTAYQYFSDFIFHRLSSYGVIRADEALDFNINDLIEIIRINEPADYEIVGTTTDKLNVPISVEVSSGGYELSIGVGEYPTEWSRLTSGTENGIAYTLDVSGFESEFYTLRITSLQDERFEDRRTIIVSNDLTDDWNFRRFSYKTVKFLKAADLDNDTKDEIVFYLHNGFGGGRLYVLDERGNNIPGWPKILSGQIHCVNILDVDNNGTKEVVIAKLTASNWQPDYLHIFIYDKYGHELNYHKIEYSTPYKFRGCRSYLTSADIDKDGTKDFIHLFSYDPYDYYDEFDCYKITVVDTNGEVLDGWPQVGTFPSTNGMNTFSADLAIGDIDADGFKEIVMLDIVGRFRVFEHNGEINHEWDKDLLAGVDNNGGTCQGLFIADINNDGYLETVVGINKLISGYPHPREFNKFIYAWDKNNRLLSGFPIEVGANRFVDKESPFALVDLDNDGDLEIITELTRLDVGMCKTKISAFHHTGEPVDGFPTSEVLGFPQERLIADINSDGVQEIILLTYSQVSMFKVYDNNRTFLSAFDAAGNIVSSFKPFYFDFPQPYGSEGQMCIADTDGDGTLNFIIAGYMPFLEDNHLYNFTLGDYTGFRDSVKWGMFRYNTTNTQCIDIVDINHTPELPPIGDKSVNEASSLSFTVTATDSDGDTVTITTSPLENWMGFDGLTFTANPGYDDSGTYSVTFTASDGRSGIDSKTITITVVDVNRPPSNQPPVLDPIENKEVLEGHLLKFTVSATDPDDDPIKYWVAFYNEEIDIDEDRDVDVGDYNMIADAITTREGDEGYIPKADLNNDDVIDLLDLIIFLNIADDYSQGSSLNSDTGEFMWVPGFDSQGSYSVTFSAYNDVDFPKPYTSRTITISVNDHENNPPALDAIEDKEIDEGRTLKFTVSATDPDDDPIRYWVAFYNEGIDIDEDKDVDAGDYNIIADAITAREGDEGYIPKADLNNDDVIDLLDLAIFLNMADDYSQGSSLNSDTGEFMWVPGFDSQGSYSVTFSAYNDVDFPKPYTSRTITISVNDAIYEELAVEATPTSGTAPLEVEFNVTGTKYNGKTIIKYEWDFDGKGMYDYTSSSSGNLAYTYTGKGNLPGTENFYTPTLRVINTEGESTTLNLNIEVLPNPSSPNVGLEADPLQGNVPLSVRFSALAESNVTGYEWDFDGDGVYDERSSTYSVVYRYRTPGIYTPAVKVIDKNGLTNTDYIYIVVDEGRQPQPEVYAHVDRTEGLIPLEVSFSVDTSGADSVLGYKWDFDRDGVYDYSSRSTGDVCHTYMQPGIYEAKLKVFTSKGLVAEDTITINARHNVDLTAPRITVSADTKNGTVPLTVNFTVSGENVDDITNFSWDFDRDGKIDKSLTSPNTSYTYNAPRLYNAVLNVTSSSGRVDKFYIPILATGDDNPWVWLEQHSRVKGNALSLTAKANAKDANRIQSITFQYKVDGDLEYHDIATATAIPYFVTWNTTAVSDGDYYIRLFVTTKQGENFTFDMDNVIIVDQDAAEIDLDIIENEDFQGRHIRKQKVAYNIANLIEILNGTSLLIPVGVLPYDDIAEMQIPIQGDIPDKLSDTNNPNIKPINAYREFTLQDNSEAINMPVTLTIPYEDRDNDGIIDGTDIKEETLRPYYYNLDRLNWQICYEFTILPDENKIVFNADHLSLFGLGGTAPGADSGDSNSPGGGGGGGGCFIATACFGSIMHNDVKVLCEFRDRYLFTNSAGSALVRFYYRHSPPIADYIREKSVLKVMVRKLLRPLIWLSRFLIR